jgi:hypothetical protein
MTLTERRGRRPWWHWILLAFCLLLAFEYAKFQAMRLPEPPPLTAEQQAAKAKAEAAQEAAAEKVYAAMTAEAAKMIRLSGYDCQTVDRMWPTYSPEGFRVHCNRYRYGYTLENHGGKWSVRAD